MALNHKSQGRHGYHDEQESQSRIRIVRLMQTYGLGELIMMFLQVKQEFSLELNKQKSSKSSEQKSLDSNQEMSHSHSVNSQT